MKITFNIKGHITLDTRTGIISGKTYTAQNWIKNNFDAKWDPENKVWIVSLERVEAEMKLAYYDKFIVCKEDDEEVIAETASASAPVKEISTEELVNCDDGFYCFTTYTDGTTVKTLIG